MKKLLLLTLTFAMLVGCEKDDSGGGVEMQEITIATYGERFFNYITGDFELVDFSYIIEPIGETVSVTVQQQEASVRFMAFHTTKVPKNTETIKITLIPMPEIPSYTIFVISREEHVMNGCYESLFVARLGKNERYPELYEVELPIEYFQFKESELNCR